MEYKGFTIFAECSQLSRWSVWEDWELKYYEYDYDGSELEWLKAEAHDIDWDIIELGSDWDDIKNIITMKEVIDEWLNENDDIELTK